MRRLIFLFLVIGLAGAAWFVLGGQDDHASEAGDPGLLTRLPEPERRAPDRSLEAVVEPRPADVTSLPLATPGGHLDPPPLHALEIEVRHADGVPASGCVVVVVRGGPPIWVATTGRDGRASGRALDGGVTAWIGGGTPQPVSSEIPEARGRHVVRLPHGDVIQGRVLVDGGLPPDPFVLGLDPGDAFDDAPAASPPWDVVEHFVPRLPGRSASYTEEGLLVGTDGTFRFSGLPSGWTGHFAPEYGWYADTWDDLAVTAPARDVVLALHRVPRIRLRVVSEGRREPEPFALVSASVESDSSSNGHGLTCDSNGRAEFCMLRWDPAHTLRMDIVNASGTARRNVVLDIEDSTRDLDLGDIELSGAWSLPFRVRTPEGRPVRGAEAAVECGADVRSDPTGFNGRGILVGLPPGCDAMFVAATRHDPVRVPLPPQPPAEPLDVVLTPCAWLDLVVTSSDGDPRQGLYVARATRRRVPADEAGSGFVREAHNSGLYLKRHGGAGSEDRREPDGSVLRTLRSCSELAGLDRVALGCVANGEVIDVEILDATRFVIWEAVGLTVPPGTTREEVAEIRMRPRAFTVRVSDEAGAPLVGAQVHVEASDGLSRIPVFPRGGQAETGDDGLATVDHVYAPLVDVSVELAGFAAATLADVDTLSVQHVMLSRGLELTLSAVTPSGRTAPLDGVWVERPDGEHVPCDVERLEGESAADNRRGPRGAYRISGLPRRSVILCAQTGGRIFRQEHDPSVPAASLLVPEFGSLTVSGLGAGADFEGSLSLQGASLSEPVVFVHEWLGRGDALRGEFRWSLVFPGRYQVKLLASAANGEDRVLAGPVEVEVVAGREALVDLR